MKFIENKVSSIITTSEDASWPITNLLDNWPQNLYKAAVGVQTATLTIEMPIGCAGFYICNTNADSGTLTITTMADAFIEDHELSFGYCTYLGYLTATQQPETFKQIWQDYTYQTDSHKLVVELTTSEATLTAGILRAGITHEFKNPNSGLGESFIDNSIVKKVADGSKYVFRRDLLRKYSGTMFSEYDLDYQAFRDFALKFKHVPIAVNLFDEFDSGLLFGELNMTSSNRITEPVNIFGLNVEETF